MRQFGCSCYLITTHIHSQFLLNIHILSVVGHFLGNFGSG